MLLCSKRRATLSGNFAWEKSQLLLIIQSVVSNTRQHFTVFIVSLLLCVGLVLQTAYAVPTTVSYQGVFKDKKGKPLNGTQVFTFSIYSVARGGSPLWTENQNISATAGNVTVLLGAVNPLKSELLTEGRYLGIRVNSDSEMIPRIVLNSSFFAMRAGIAESVANGSVGNDKLSPNAVNSEKIVDGTIVTTKLAANSVTTDKIANGAVTTEKLSADVQQKLAQTGTASVPAAVATLNVTEKLKVGKNSIYLGPTMTGGTDNSIYTDTSDLLVQSDTTKIFNTVINANNAGKVGIGTNTPKAKLEIWDTIKVSAPLANQSGSLGEGLFMHYDATLKQGEILVKDFATFTGYKTLQVIGNPIVLNHNMYSSPTYNVGIGTGTPKNKLDVAGSVAIGSGYAGVNIAPANGLLVEGDVGIGTNIPFTKLDVKSENSEVMRFTHSLGQLYFTGPTKNPQLPSSGASSTLVLQTLDKASDANTRLIFLNHKGEVNLSLESYSINESSSWNTMNSEAKAGLWFRYVGDGVMFVKDYPGGNRVYALTLDKDGRTSFGANVGIRTSPSASYSLNVAGNAYTTGNWGSSDIRWKKNVALVENALQKVSQLRGVSYEWKIDEYPNNGFTEGKQIGFLAQEVEPVLPELVSTDDKGYKAVAYDKMTAVLVEAVKELKAQNDALKTIVCKDHPTEVLCQ